MHRQETNSDAVVQLFGELHEKYDNTAPEIIEVIVRTLGGIRLTFPDIHFFNRLERNRRMRDEFDGRNYVDLAVKYRLQVRQARRIIDRK